MGTTDGHEIDPVVGAIIGDPPEGGTHGLAGEAIAGLIQAGWTVATAESITGGGVCAALTDIAGASRCVRGGVVSYASEVKRGVLGVDADLLRRRGAVDAEVAEQMARGVAALLGADCAIATTGSAGPEPASGGSQTDPVAPGTVFIAVHSPLSTWVEQLTFTGDRAHIRACVVTAALHALIRTMRG